jgi:hypothetical protein
MRYSYLLSTTPNSIRLFPKEGHVGNMAWPQSCDVTATVARFPASIGD